jgi:hypothetical protein
LDAGLDGALQDGFPNDAPPSATDGALGEDSSNDGTGTDHNGENKAEAAAEAPSTD